MTARAKYDAASAHAMAMCDIAGKLRALIVALGDDGTRLAAAYREVAAAEGALADDAAKAYAEVPRAPTTDADRDRVVREVRGAGWVATEIGSLVLRRSDGVGSHAVVHGQVWRTANASGSAPTLEAAQLAAEDALRAIAAEILRAVGA